MAGLNRPGMIIDLEAMRIKDESGRRCAQKPRCGAVIAAGERQCGLGGERKNKGVDIPEPWIDSIRLSSRRRC
jgi:hypothetical protein